MTKFMNLKIKIVLYVLMVILLSSMTAWASLNSNQAFIEHIYLNTLNKTLAEDAAGIAYWVDLLDQGSTRGQVSALLVGVIKDYAPVGPYYNPADAATVAVMLFRHHCHVCLLLLQRLYNNPAGQIRAALVLLNIIPGLVKDLVKPTEQVVPSSN